jgi:MFS family permease
MPPMLIAIAIGLDAPLASVVQAAGAYFLAYGLMQPVWGMVSDELGLVRTMRLTLLFAGLASVAGRPPGARSPWASPGARPAASSARPTPRASSTWATPSRPTGGSAPSPNSWWAWPSARRSHPWVPA